MKMRILVLGGLLVLSICLVAENRVALLIANGRYQHFSSLAGPVSEATGLSATLQKLGFDVQLVENGSREQMLEALDGLQKRIGGKGGIAFFHYGGHGVQVNGKNYLIPADADIPDERKAATRAVDIDEVMSSLEACGSDTNIVVLDACRNNPLPAGSGRSASRGLSVVATKPKNSVIVYSAEAGTIAQDGLFTPTLTAVLAQPGLNIADVLLQVRQEVYRKSQGSQIPGEYNQLFANVYLNGSATATPSAPLVSKPAVATLSAAEALALEQAEKWPELIARMPAFSDFVPNDFALSHALGEAYFNQGLPDKALPYFQQANILDPSNIWVLSRLSQTTAALGDFASALSWAKLTLTRDPNFGWGYYNVVNAAFGSQDYALAKKYLTTGLAGHYEFEADIKARLRDFQEKINLAERYAKEKTNLVFASQKNTLVYQSTLMDYGSGTLIKAGYAGDPSYKPCIELKSCNGGWLGGSGVALAFVDIRPAIPAAAYTAIIFKLKPGAFTKVGFIINDSKSYNARMLVDYSQKLANGWYQVTIPFKDIAIQAMPASIKSLEMGFSVYPELAGSAYITDIGFK